jgi:hypothetical protein
VRSAASISKIPKRASTWLSLCASKPFSACSGAITILARICQ